MNDIVFIFQFQLNERQGIVCGITTTAFMWFRVNGT